MTAPDEKAEESISPDNASNLREFARKLNMTAEHRTRLNRLVMVLWLSSLIILGIWVVIRGRDEFASTIDELKAADLSWIAIAVLIQGLMLVFSGLSYKVILRRLGHSVPLRNMANAHLQRTAISSVTPGGGPASVFIFVRHCIKLGVPASDGFLTIAVRSIGVSITFVAVLIPGAAVDHSLPGAVISAIGLGILSIGAIALFRGERDNWETPLIWTAKLPAWFATRLQDFILRFRDHGLKPVDLFWPIVLALLVRLTIVGVLWACLAALGERISMQTMLTTYFASIVASTAIPLFGGAGAVEAVSILTLSQAGVPAEIAIGATLLWRLIDLWIPVAIGLLLHARQELPALKTSSDEEGVLPQHLPETPYPT
ncbi:hypothetical protein BH23CHL5_BH23CHL5_16200 [soil metagenome]